MKIIDIEILPLRVPYEARIRKRFYHFGMNEHLTIYKFRTDTGLVGLGGDAGGGKQYAPWINIAGINASASVVEKAMSVAGATGDGDKDEDE